MDTTQPHDRHDHGDHDGTPTWGSPGPADRTARPPVGEEPVTHRQPPPFGAQEPGGPGRPTAPRTPPGARFFDGVRRLGVVRPDDDRWVAGVCAGLARRWGMRPGLVRFLFVLLGLLTGAGLALYGLLWLLLPHPDGRIHAQQVLSGVVTGGFVGGVLAILADGPDPVWADHTWHHHGSGLVPLVLVGLAVWWIARRHRTTPTR